MAVQSICQLRSDTGLLGHFPYFKGDRFLSCIS